MNKAGIILLAGGKGERFGTNTPKQYKYISGKTILEYVLDSCLKSFSKDNIIIVVNKDHKGFYDPILNHYKIDNIAFSGKMRKDSVFNALQYISKKDFQNILIHDVARPFFSKDLVSSILAELQIHKSCIPILKSEDSLRMINESANNILNREQIFRVQTPQAFSFCDLYEAHKKAQKNNKTYTDDASLFEDMGHKINFIAGEKQNFKITEKSDLKAAINQIEKKMENRVGIGYDIHSFSKKGIETEITLGGVKIPHNKEIIAHSDGDLVIHSLVDALLGALSMGDIGDHFPPSDNKFKNMDSSLFLIKVKEFLAEKNAEIVNIDITIIAEAPLSLQIQI